ncbi:hypothetical protein I4U23_000928 [Adineta vaga]|nr:hypothetical protein I4U23_000928 [Adineta vaga]
MTCTTLSEKKQVVSLTRYENAEDDDLDIDTKSSNDSEKTLEDVECMSNKKMKHQMSIPEVSTSKVVQKDISKAVYDYATTIHKNRFDQDAIAVHGSNDPPPGFGVLHPPMHYLTQERPFPLEPLPVWRGYNGNIYFSPIQVQHFESDRSISCTKSSQSTSLNNIVLRKKTNHDQSHSVLLPINTNRNSIKERNEKFQKETVTNITTTNNEVKNQQLNVSTHENIEDYEPIKPCHSLYTSSHTRLKPILKTSQQSIEDQVQKQSSKDLLKHKRQILPNIHLVPKPKLIHKGLAYKESQKLPSLTNEMNSNLSQQPFEPHIQHTSHSTRAKQKQQQVSFIPASTLLTQNHSIFDLREIRKRIIKGATTTSNRTPIQSMAWSPTSTDRNLMSNSDISRSVQTINLSNHVPLSSVSSHHQLKYNTKYTTPNLSQYFEVFPPNNTVNFDIKTN